MARPPILIPMFTASAVIALLMALVAFATGTPFILAVIAAVAAFVVSLMYAGLFGVPYSLLLHRFGRFRVLPMAIGGFVIGALPELVFMPDEPRSAAVMGLLGLCAAVVFYVSSRRVSVLRSAQA